MNTIRLTDALTHIDDALIAEAASDTPIRRRQLWTKYAAVAACLCLAVTALFISWVHTNQGSPAPPDTDTPSTPSPDTPSPDTSAPETAGGPPYIIHEGESYLVSPYGASTWDEVLPDGYSLAGTTLQQDSESGNGYGEESYPYYTNPDTPYLIYVYHSVALSQPASSAKWEERYVPYVHESVRYKYFLSRDGQLYIRLLDARYADLTDHPALSDELLMQWTQSYQTSIKELPEGFVSIGKATLAERYTLPDGALCSSHFANEVYANPDNPDMLLQEETRTYSDGSYTSYTVYVRYGMGLDEEQLLPWFRTTP